jgi:hypothetical protein
MSSASVGFCPKDRMTVPSSLVVMVPVGKEDDQKVRGTSQTLIRKARDNSTEQSSLWLGAMLGTEP